MGRIESSQRSGPQDDVATTIKATGETGRDLTVQELDSVAGGKLKGACATGKHLPEVIIEAW